MATRKTNLKESHDDVLENHDRVVHLRKVVHEHGDRGIEHVFAISDALCELRAQDPFKDLFKKNKELWSQLHVDLDYSTAQSILRIAANQAMRDPELQKRMPRSLRTLIAIAGIAIDDSKIKTERDREKATSWARLNEEMRPTITREEVRAYAPQRRASGRAERARNDEYVIVGLRVPKELGEVVVDEVLSIASRFVFDYDDVAISRLTIRRESRPPEGSNRPHIITAECGEIIQDKQLMRKAYMLKQSVQSRATNLPAATPVKPAVETTEENLHSDESAA